MFVIIGTANVDLIVSGFDQMPVVMGDEFTTSSLVFCDAPLQMVLGGNGGNCAYVLAGLGASTALCSAIGTDELGRIVQGWLAEQGVHLDSLRQNPQQATAFTTIVSDRNLNRLAFHHPGALAAFGYADIPADLLKKAAVVLATSYTIMPKLRPSGWSQALALAKASGAITAVDIGPAIGRPAQVDELIALMPHVDYWLTNRHELAVCTGCDEVAAGANRLLAVGANTVIVKLGKAGAAVCTSTEYFHVPAFAVDVRSTVGAGDSFNAGLLYGLQQGWPVAQAARLGNAVAALVISSEQGILGCPSLARVEGFLQENA